MNPSEATGPPAGLAGEAAAIASGLLQAPVALREANAPVTAAQAPLALRGPHAPAPAAPARSPATLNAALASTSAPAYDVLTLAPEKEEILRRAAAIRARRGARVPAPAAEPPRKKAFWDYLLDEMQWMAKEFASERKLKLRQCKAVALKASRSNLDVASRAEARTLSPSAYGFCARARGTTTTVPGLCAHAHRGAPKRAA